MLIDSRGVCFRRLSVGNGDRHCKGHGDAERFVELANGFSEVQSLIAISKKKLMDLPPATINADIDGSAAPETPIVEDGRTRLEARDYVLLRLKWQAQPPPALTPEKRTLMRIPKATLCVLLLSQFVLSQTAALHSIDETDLDRKVDPCTDFSPEFCQWFRGAPAMPFPLPWCVGASVGSPAETPHQNKLKDVLEVAQANTTAAKGSTDQIIGDYYGACMDETKVNARGIEPQKTWFCEDRCRQEHQRLTTGHRRYA